MPLTATCCCGETVNAMLGTCDRCAMERCSFGWCKVLDAPAEGL